jgi:formylglycine-generating enzyme required for sulfatase activity
VAGASFDRLVGLWAFSLACGAGPREAEAPADAAASGPPPAAVAEALPSPDRQPTDAAPPTPTGRVVAACAPGVDPATGCFVALPSGSFVYGAQAADRSGVAWDPDARPEEGPPERREVPALWMQNSEAPWWQYQRCVEAGGCVAPGSASVSAPPSREIAVTGLTFSEAEAFCRFLGGRLPTEIEWEYAAKGGDGRRFPWGEVARCPSSSPEEEEPISVARDAIVRRCDDLVSRVFRDGGHEAIDKMGVVLTTWDAARMDRACAIAHAAADPLAAFLAELDAGWKVAAAEPARRTCKQSAAYEVGWMRSDHPWGLMGLGGNVMEWTADAAGAARRAVRGGSFLAEDARGWRTAARASMPEGLRAADVGVRCVRDTAP